MTHAELAAALSALKRRLDNRVEIWRVLIAPDGTAGQRVFRGAFQAAPGWEAPSLETLIAKAKGRRNDT